MFELILSSLMVFVSTSMDYLSILLIVFAAVHGSKARRQIYWGQYLGTVILVAISLLVAYWMKQLPSDEMIGLLGLIPLALGIRLALVGEEEAEEADILSRLTGRKHSTQWLNMALITLASGGDNLGHLHSLLCQFDLVRISFSHACFCDCNRGFVLCCLPLNTVCRNR